VISEPLLRSFCGGLRQQRQFARELHQRTNRFLVEEFSTFTSVFAEPYRVAHRCRLQHVGAIPRVEHTT
jgi:hypothetical protein